MMGVVRSLGRAKVPVSVFSAHPHSPARFSRYCDHHLVPDAARNPKKLEAVLLEHAQNINERPILFPIGDAEVAFLADHSEQLGPRYQFHVSHTELIRRLINKETQYELARNCSIQIPHTYFGINSKNMASHDIQFPVVIKPSLSHVWPWHGVTKAVSADNPVQLESRLRDLESHNIDVVVQSIIPGPPSDLYTVVAYINKAGSAAVVASLRKLRHFPLDFGFGSLNETVSAKPLEALVIRFLRDLEFTGVCGLEFKFDPRDGQFKFIEINPRFELAHHLFATAGADVARAMYADISGHPASGSQTYRLGMRWISLTLDLKASGTLLRRGELKFGSWIRSLQNLRTEALLTWDDPLPGLCSYGRTLRCALMPEQSSGPARLGLHTNEEAQG